MKKKYVEPELEVIRYDEEDVIMASGCIEAGDCNGEDDTCPDGDEGSGGGNTT